MTMLKVTRIMLRSGHDKPEKLGAVDAVYVPEVNICFPIEKLYDYLLINPESICVGAVPIVPVLEPNGEKFVKSIPDVTGKDMLLQLPYLYEWRKD